MTHTDDMEEFRSDMLKTGDEFPEPHLDIRNGEWARSEYEQIRKKQDKDVLDINKPQRQAMKAECHKAISILNNILRMID